MTDAPEVIYLQWIPNDIPFNDEITWCVDEIHEDDTKYIRADVVAAKDDALAIAEHIKDGLRETIDAKNARIAELEGEIDDYNQAELAWNEAMK